MQGRVDAVIRIDTGEEVPVTYSGPLKCPKCGKTEFGKVEFWTVHRPVPADTNTRLEWAKTGRKVVPQLMLKRAYFKCKACGEFAQDKEVVAQLYPENGYNIKDKEKESAGTK